MSQKFADFLLEALANAARIDGDAAAPEREAIAAAMSRATGAPFAGAAVDAAIAAARFTRQDLTAYLRKRHAQFSRAQRMTILRELLSVIAADGLFAAPEREALEAYIEAIGFAESQVETILDALVAPFRNAV